MISNQRIFLLPLLLAVTIYGCGSVEPNASGSGDKEANQGAKNRVKAKMVYARQDIKEGQPITADQLELRDCESTTPPSDSLSGLDQVVGKTAKYSIVAGQIVSKEDLTEK